MQRSESEKQTFRIDGFRVVVSEGFRACVYLGRKKVGHWAISPPWSDIALGFVDYEYVARVAVDAAKEASR